ncbi:hypothetical protein PJF56_08080 [Roseofilum sp. BLCC_M91]|uniref:SbsA Ig-like domain-containing protein n=1 Tax=Roseofilum halophilum BLCC-M91 TaxID=3022259 RepID=A0ABT7BI03_9CYAN|nr:hypothetical protein [Roseofilum halophilum]MDJ1178817.1 hypothetical protein [Roseofilum halophilum BLCC-M91]
MNIPDYLMDFYTAKIEPKVKDWQPLDRVVIGVVIVLFVVMFFLVITGRNAAPRVRAFTWENKTIMAQDKAFILQFSHPMNRESVENNLKIEPSLSGKTSWAGRRMAYTLNKPAPYGTEFKVQIEGARDQYSDARQGATIQPFVGQFRTRDRVFVYIGNQGEESGRLILYNLTQNHLEILSPPNLEVMAFEPYPDRDRILFSARDTEAESEELIEQKLYTTTTGLKSGENPGIIEDILDNETHQNLAFDLSPDGKTIVVQRVNRDDPGDFGLWLIPEKGDPYPMENQPGGEFLITPDSQALALLQGEGVALLPLYPDDSEPTNQPLDFLPKFGQILSFAPDGSAATMIKFNTDFTRSLYLVTNQGTEKELLKTNGSIKACEFDPTQTLLYCLLSELLPGEVYQELPYISLIDLETSKQIPLVGLPNQREIQISLSPDGVAILFDHNQVDALEDSPATPPENSVNSNLWILPIIDADQLKEDPQIKPEVLPLKGSDPQWLP